MLIENSFEVAAPIETVWDYLLDVERVVPCMPGAELTETIDDSNWKGKINIKVGPVSLSFKGKVELVESDASARRVVLKGSGMEQRGKGAASATVTYTLEGSESGTVVAVVQDLKVQGQAAQFSRGMMQDVSSKLTKRFADCLQSSITAGPEPAAAPGQATLDRPVAGKPIGGLRLFFSAMGSAIARFFRRVFTRKSAS
jgi:uncharacterized protein